MPEAAGRLRVLERVPVTVFGTEGGVQLGTVGAAGVKTGRTRFILGHRRDTGGGGPPQSARKSPRDCF
jgi:hypothetical protein